jgi:ribonucleoside-triphosphate reductase
MRKIRSKEMRNLEDIDQDLAAAREALSHAEGTPAEVYSRIVGYYRSVRNWNKGKREEYGERKLFRVSAKPVLADPAPQKAAESRAGGITAGRPGAGGDRRLLLFVRPACPACPGAKAAAGRLGIPVDLVNADTEDGLAEAVRRQVFSTPTAILLTREGEELDRALDAAAIASWRAEPFKEAASL